MNDTAGIVEDSCKLTEVFGYWPSFHDAEVINITLNRDCENNTAALTADIHVFEMTNQVSGSGTYICRHHSIVTIFFTEIDGLELDAFNHQNALMQLSIEDISQRQLERVKLSVIFEPAYGFGCNFVCRSARVISVQAGIPQGSVYA
ncbi:Imm50 family immunity protein [Pseudomonas sp. F(2018)]|uniref:Imm50 family immunity protein n=1 Tax=Pseudomonas sp. F(2018) TaxID=2502240 RepID=UPI0010F75880|nr:Imm50 family immunity protein [Pseudomonas sp. F(2018)]